MGYFRAVAVDYDGTLTDGSRPSEAVLDALARARREAGLRLILVTGRILGELRHEFPDFEEHFDRIVAENGAVLHAEGVTRALTAPVPVSLDGALIRRGIDFRRGRVLLACDGEHDVAVLEDLRELGLDCQLARNRGQLMVVPAGVTKGRGVTEALAHLGISRHSAVAVGDAENDQSLLEACELGFAVANAVPSLQERADVVLGSPDGEGVASLLGGPLIRDELAVEPRRWQVDLGRTAGGEPVLIPGSRVNVLVTGGSGSGKSYAAGFLAERLVGLGYSVCIFDPEGDHGPLGRLRGVVGLGGREGLPDPAQIARILQQGLGSVVVDLSLNEAERDAYVRRALEVLQKLRTETGLPHWIVVDEAHQPLGGEGPDGPGFDPGGRGYCLVTYRPQELWRSARGAFDFLLAMPGERGVDPGIREALAGLTGIEATALESTLAGTGRGQAVLVRRGAPAELRTFTLAPRWLEHVRHWHKYAGARLPAPERFTFRSSQGPTGAVAANLAEFHHEVRRCPPPVLRHHAAASDFSRWIHDVIQDALLADAVREIEQRLRHVPAGELEALRGALLERIEIRYLG